MNTTKTRIVKSRMVPCRVAGCDKGPFKSPIAECTHYHRIHSGRIKVPHQKKIYPVTLTTNGPDSKIDLGTDRPLAAEPPFKRKYRKNLQHGKATQVEVNFCPKCGTDLCAVAAGLILKGAKTHISFCPGCGLDLHNVATGMAITPLTKKHYGKHV